jgi:hypothetical protein
MAMLAVVVSRTRVTVPVPGSWRARAVIRGPAVSGQAGSGALPPHRARACAPASRVSARSIWSQAAPKFSPTRAEVGAAGDAVFHQPGGLRLVREGAGAGVDAQLGLQRMADVPGADEADQVLGEDRRLRPGGQADGQPPGGDMIDGAAAGVGGGDAIADQPLVQRQIRELALLGSRVREELTRWPAGRVATCDGRCCGTRTGHQAIDAVRLSRQGTGGCCRARPSGGAGLRSGLGVGHRVAALGGDAGEQR